MTHRTTDPLDALLAHNLWATRLILEKCRALTDEQLRRPFPIGPGDRGGLFAILTHIVGAMRRWADRIAHRTVRPPIESWRPNFSQADAPTTLDALMTMLEDAHTDLSAVIADVRRRNDLARPIIFQFPGPSGPVTHTFTAGAAIASAAVHGHYHRAQCMNILRQLNIPAASIDVIDWQLAEEPS